MRKNNIINKGKSMKKGYIFFLLGTISFIIFCKTISKDSTGAAFLMLLTMISSFVFYIVSLVFLIKGLIQKKKAKKAANNTANIPSIDINNSLNNKKEELKFVDFVHDGKFFEVKYQYYDVNIVGTQYHPAPADLKYGEFVRVKPDKNNAYDSNAVGIYAIRNDEEQILGYLSKESRLYDMANDYFKSDKLILAKLSSVENMQIAMAFLKRNLEKDYVYYSENKTPAAEFIITTKDDYCDTLSYADTINYEYDYNKEKYLINGDESIGYLSSSKQQYASNEYISFVSDIDYDENIKLHIEVFEK